MGDNNVHALFLPWFHLLMVFIFFPCGASLGLELQRHTLLSQLPSAFTCFVLAAMRNALEKADPCTIWIELLLLTVVIACTCQMPLLSLQAPLLLSVGCSSLSCTQFFLGLEYSHCETPLDQIDCWHHECTLLLIVLFGGTNHKSTSTSSCSTYGLPHAYVH